MRHTVRRGIAATIALAYVTACAGNFGSPKSVAPETAVAQLDDKGKLWVTTDDTAYILEHTWVERDSVFGMRPDGQSTGVALDDVREVRTWHGGGWKTAALIGGIYAAAAIVYAISCSADDYWC